MPAQRLSLTLLAGMALSVGLAPFNSTLIVVALPEMGSDLRVGAGSLTQWLVTGYLLASVVCQSPAGKFGDLWGHDRAISIGRWLFIAGALLGGLVPSLYALVAARIMMAMGGAMLIPPSMALLRILVAPENRGRVFGVFASVVAIAAAAGPLVGAWLTENFGWSSVFWVNLPVVLCSWLLAPTSALPAPDSVPDTRPRFDVAGSLLLAVALIGIVLSLQWRELRVPLLLAGGLAGWFFLRVEKRVVAPVLDLSLFSHRNYSLGVVIAALQNLGLYGLLILLPHLQADLYGGGLSHASLPLFGLMGAMVVMSPLGGRLADLMGARVTILVGSLLSLGAILLVSQPHYWPSTGWLFSILLMAGTGIGFCTAPAQAVALGAVATGQSGMASGVMQMNRYLGSMLSTALAGLVLSLSVSSQVLRYSYGLRVYCLAFAVSALLALMLRGGRNGT